jgi:hypothetical protein
MKIAASFQQKHIRVADIVGYINLIYSLLAQTVLKSPYVVH